MKLFLDSAHFDHWQALAPLGLFEGITTNPLLIERAGLDCTIETYRRLYHEAMELGFSGIHFQVFGPDWLTTAHAIAAIGPNAFVKIPATQAGFTVAQRLSLPDRTTLTAVYSPGQVIAAEAMGVAFCAPYYARLKESGHNADQAFADMHSIADRTELLVASLRSPEQLIQLASRGFSTFALPEAIASTFFASDLADQAVVAFEAAAASS